MILYKRGFGVTSVLLLALLGSVSMAQGAIVLFQDNFDTIRPSGTATTGATDTVGNGWVEVNKNSNDVAIADLSFTSGLQGAMRLRDENAAASLFNLSTKGYDTIKLSFDWRLLDTAGEDNDKFTVSWKTQAATSWTDLFSTGLGGSCFFICSWEAESIALGASASDNDPIQLRFWTNVDSSNEGVFVDNVRLTGESITQGVQASADVPEPGTIALLGLGLAGLGFLKRRKA